MSEQPAAFTAAQDGPLFVPHPETPRPSLFTILVVDLFALAIAFFGSQVSDDEGISGVIVMMVMIGALAGHVVFAHVRRAFDYDSSSSARSTTS